MSAVKVEIPIDAKDASNVDVLKLDTIEKLFISIPEKAKELLYRYLMKLLDINFPLEKRLVSGLLQMIGEKMAMKYILDDKLLEDFVAYFYEKHSNVAV
ncbi:Type III pantothenate kinase [Dirofilaria immitis]